MTVWPWADIATTIARRSRSGSFAVRLIRCKRRPSSMLIGRPRCPRSCPTPNSLAASGNTLTTRPWGSSPRTTTPPTHTWRPATHPSRRVGSGGSPACSAAGRSRVRMRVYFKTRQVHVAGQVARDAAGNPTTKQNWKNCPPFGFCMNSPLLPILPTLGMPGSGVTCGDASRRCSRRGEVGRPLSRKYIRQAAPSPRECPGKSSQPCTEPGPPSRPRVIPPAPGQFPPGPSTTPTPAPQWSSTTRPSPSGTPTATAGPAGTALT